MFTSGNQFSIGLTEAPSRDAADGFSSIALALDHGLNTTTGRAGGGIVDVLGIAAGWAVLLAVIFYPALQLAAIGVGVAIMAGRSIMRGVLQTGSLKYFSRPNRHFSVQGAAAQLT